MHVAMYIHIDIRRYRMYIHGYRCIVYVHIYVHVHTVPFNSNLTHTRNFRDSTREILHDDRKIFLITPHVYLIYYSSRAELTCLVQYSRKLTRMNSLT